MSQVCLTASILWLHQHCQGWPLKLGRTVNLFVRKLYASSNLAHFPCRATLCLLFKLYDQSNPSVVANALEINPFSFSTICCANPEAPPFWSAWSGQKISKALCMFNSDKIWSWLVFWPPKSWTCQDSHYIICTQVWICLTNKGS